jgi:2-oxoglutarate ferredoxin oxidoreductase subunit gamma
LEKIEIRISGFGGQGVVLAGQILGKAAVYDGKNVVQTQSYGAEARGSMAKSEVIISEGKIGFPLVRRCDILVAMNQEALEKNINDQREDGTLLVDSGTVKTIPKNKAKTFKVPATEIAEASCGGKLYANMVMLGALIKITKVVSKSSVELAIKNSVAEKTAVANLQAFKKGEKSESSKVVSHNVARVLRYSRDSKNLPPSSVR